MIRAYDQGSALRFSISNLVLKGKAAGQSNECMFCNTSPSCHARVRMNDSRCTPAPRLGRELKEHLTASLSTYALTDIRSKVIYLPLQYYQSSQIANTLYSPVKSNFWYIDKVIALASTATADTTRSALHTIVRDSRVSNGISKGTAHG